MFEGQHAKITKVKPDEYVELIVYKNSGRVKVDRYETVDYNRFLFADYASHMWRIEPEGTDIEEVPKWHQHARDMFDLAWEDKHPMSRPETFEEKKNLLVLLADGLPKVDLRRDRLAEFIQTEGKSWVSFGLSLRLSCLHPSSYPGVQWL